jgi:hypothetical protein
MTAASAAAARDSFWILLMVVIYPSKGVKFCTGHRLNAWRTEGRLRRRPTTTRIDKSTYKKI